MMWPDYVLEKFKNLKELKPNTWICTCPCHDDVHPSLSIRLAENRLLLKCFAGCSTSDILESCGLTWADLFAPETETVEEAFLRHGLDWPFEIKIEDLRVEADGAELIRGKTWLYLAKSKKLTKGGKFKLFWKSASGSQATWLEYKPNHPRSFYTWIVEGIWDFLHLAQEGYHVVTPTNGAAQKLDEKILNMNAFFVICFDNDQAGRKNGLRNYKILKNKGRPVKVVKWPANVPEGFDICDFLNQGGNLDRLEFFDPAEIAVIEESREMHTEDIKEDIKESSSTEDRELIELDNRLIPEISFPFDVFPPDFLEFAYKFANALHVDPEETISLMLAILSAAIGNSVRVSPKAGYEVSLFIWLILIAPSGHGKSPIMKKLLEPLNELEAKANKEYEASLIKYKEQFKKAKTERIALLEKPKLKSYLVADTTVEALADIFKHNPRGVLIYQDEISGLILGLNQYKRGKGNDRQHYLELFNSASWKIDRKYESQFISNTGAAIIGGIQPKIVPKVFSQHAFDDGLLPRFLILNIDPKPLRFSRESITEKDSSYWSSLLYNCYGIPLSYDDNGFVNPKRLILSDEALDLYEEFYNEYGRLYPLLSEKAQVFIPKLTSYYTLKFAGILHILKTFCEVTFVTNVTFNLNKKIQSETISQAIELTKYFAGQSIRILDLYSGKEPLNKIRKRLINTLYKLRAEVRGGKLSISRITEVFNSSLPEKSKLTPKMIGSMLRNMGLSTQKSSHNLSFLLWEEEKIQKFFALYFKGNKGNNGNLTTENNIGCLSPSPSKNNIPQDDGVEI